MIDDVNGRELVQPEAFVAEMFESRLDGMLSYQEEGDTVARLELLHGNLCDRNRRLAVVESPGIPLPHNTAFHVIDYSEIVGQDALPVTCPVNLLS